MPQHQGGERFVIELQAQPDDVPPSVRLRAFLKQLLRQHRFRCTGLAETTPPKPPQDASESDAVGTQPWGRCRASEPLMRGKGHAGRQVGPATPPAEGESIPVSLQTESQE
jgi:hypothetical protein